MIDTHSAPLTDPTRHTSPRRGVHSGSDGYPRAAFLQSGEGTAYSLYDDFAYEEPSPNRQLRYTRPTIGNTPPTKDYHHQHPLTNEINHHLSLPYYQAEATHNALTKSPWGGSLWNPATQGNSVLRSFFVLSNAMFGAGIASQAMAASRVGWMMFLIMQVVVACAADWTHVLMIDLAESTGVTSYEDLVDGLYGTIGAAVVSVVILIQNVGSMLLYVMLFSRSAPIVAQWVFDGDSTLPMYDPLSMPTRAAYSAIAILLFVVPLSFFQRIWWLGVTSGIVTVCIVYITCDVVNTYYMHDATTTPSCSHPLPSPSTTNISSFSFTSTSVPYSPSSSSPCAIPVHLPSVTFDSSSFVALPLIMYSYMSHTTILPVHHEISGVKRQGVKRSNAVLVSRLTMTLSVIVYAIVGVFGGMTYSSKDLHFNIFENYQHNLPSKDLYAYFLLLCWSMTMGFSIASLLYPTKRTMMLSLIPIVRGRRVGTSGPPPSWTTNILVSLLLSLVVGVGSIFLPYACLEYILVGLGATTSTILVVVTPALFYLKLHGCCARDAHGRVASFGFGRFVACLLLVLGFLCGPVCLIGSVVHWTSS